MLIVCTQDATIRNTAQNPGSGANAWGNLVLLPIGPRGPANTQFGQSLANLPANQALCLSAHGNDTELGDAQGGWTWTVADIAGLLIANAPNWTGPILIHACAENISNFSAHLAVELDSRRRFNGLWCFGYNRAVPANSGYPPPGDLSHRVDLQGTQVHF